MTRLSLLLPLALAACDSSPAGSDGYRFERAEYTRTAPDMTFVVHANVADLRAAAPRETRAAVAGDGRELMAWSVIQGDRCTVHIINPSVSYQPEWIGHEVTHCIFGRWHR